VDQLIDSRREFSTQCMTVSKSWDIFILVDQLIDIRREFSTSYMTFPSLYSPFWWISSSTAVVSLAPNA
jgi:hypothetical protein